MKAAFLLAHTSAGWSLLASGPDTAALRDQFKQVKVAGFCDVGGKSADRILYMDTSGNMKRKDLDEASAVAGRKVAAAKAAALAAEEEKRKAAETEEGQARAKAEAIAKKAVGVIAESIASVATPASGVPSVAPATAASASTAPSAAPAPAPAASTATDEDETRSHFGGGAPAPAAKKR